MKNMFKNAVMAVVGLAVVVFALSCGPNEDNIASPEFTRVRFFHAVADAPAVNVYVDETRLNLLSTFAKDSLRYGTGYPGDSTYMTVAPGAKALKVTGHNATAALISATATMENKKNYSVFVIDSLAKPSAIVVEDVLPAVKQAALVRFAHLSPNAGNVDIWDSRDTVKPIVANVPYKTISGFLEIPVTGVQQNLTINVRPAGNKALNIVGLTSTAFIAGRCYTFLVRGRAGAPVALAPAISTIQHGR